jgi:uncharacterized protein DUF732
VDIDLDETLVPGTHCLDILRKLRRATGGVIAVGATVFVFVALAGMPVSRADVVAYLVNVTVRPGYNFANADDAIQYGQGVCDKIDRGRTYAEIMGDVAGDFGTSDDNQASYLITQAVNELCPASIWQLRQSAAHYRPAA